MKRTIINFPEAIENIDSLVCFRKEKGLRQRDFAELSGVSISVISNYEKGSCLPSVETYNKLAQFFGWKIITDEDLANAIKTEEARQILAARLREEALNFSFNVDEVYYIDGYNLRYVGKQGIHHCFKSVSGGWTRTYTNCQLVGRRIKPQQEKEEALGHYTRKI